ncbi:type 1 fimbria pilin [Pseudomonas fluorescens]|uniref:fimbrial protein n=1 Tax=Pseudomonas fluorescens TaxID=294 RepID=UPI00209E2D2F|nr:fimbrial protein [Pseudomonas fluorescens]MCP1488436.1 type 1 fimbria pilin [Pseudomonas fluorescens]
MSSYYIRYNIVPARPDSGLTVRFEGENYRLYTTNISDVYFIGSVIGPDKVSRPFGTPNEQAAFPTVGATLNFDATVRIRFYSTSTSMRVGEYNINALTLVTGLAATEFRTVGDMYVKSFPFSFVVKGPSCQLDAPANLPLKSLNIASLPAVGDTSLGANFQLNVKCGIGTPAYKVSYSMVDIYNATNTSDTLILENSAGSASGVSLKIMDGGLPVKYGLLSKGMIGSNPKDGSLIAKPLSVHYVRTASNIKPGAVKAGVSITLSYD